jgi:hypothetical protein
MPVVRASFCKIIRRVDDGNRDADGTTVQIGNAGCAAAIGAVFFGVESLHSSRAAFFVVLVLFAG